MFCRNCGSELREGALFCPNCGNKVVQTEQKEVIHAQIKEEKVATSEKVERKDNAFDVKKYIPVIAIVLVVCVIGIVALGGSKDTPSNVVGGDEQNQTEIQYDSEQDSESSVDNDVIVKDEQENQIQTENTDVGESDSQSGYLEQNGMDVILDNSNNIVGEISKYKDSGDGSYYYEVIMSGIEEKFKFSFSSMVDMSGMCSFADKQVDICSEGFEHMLTVRSVKYSEENWNMSETMIKNGGVVGWKQRVPNGFTKEDRSDNYIKIYYELDGADSYKGYEGMICDKEKELLLYFIYLEPNDKYNDERAREVVDSISTEFSQLNDF